MAKTDSAVAPFVADEKGESFMEWVRANSNKLSIAALVVVAAVAAGMLWKASAEKKEVRASQALSAAQNVVMSGNAALAQSDLQALLRRYGGTTAAIQARMLLAQVLFGQGKVDEGLKELDAVTSPGPFAASLHALKGAGLEQSGKPAEAATAYESASSAATTNIGKAAYKADAARAYMAAGNPAAAIKIYEALAAEDSNPLAGEARVRLGEIKAKQIG